MDKVMEILKQIEGISSKIDKERILRDNIDNELLKKTLEYALNPYKIYGIGTTSIGAKKGCINVEHMFDDIFSLLDYLAVTNTSNYTKDVVNHFLNCKTPERKEWYTRIILKKLRIGATEGTINKVFPNLIPVFEVQLAKSWHEHCHKVKGDIIITTKLDGVRCAIIKEKGEVKFISRQGQRFTGLTHLEKEAKMLPDNFVFDGELLAKNHDNLSAKDLYRLTMKMVSKDGEKDDVEFHMFDMLSLEDFNNGKSKNCCETRKNSITEHLRIIGSKWIKDVPVLYHGDDYSMVKTLLDEALAKGVEGVMVNLAKSVYQCKRTDTLLKAKAVQSCDIEIVGFEEGEGKYKGTLGSLVVDYKGNREVGVGSGLSDADRAFIWLNRENLIGTIVEVEFTEETNNQNNEKVSMRFPRFLRLRPDKIEPSYN